MNIAVIGTGYVGIVSAVVYADFGNQVWGVDIDPKRVETLKKGIPPIHEPRLDEFLQRGLKAKRLHFTSSYQEALDNCQIVFICVGTPQSDSGKVDLRYVETAVESIAKALKQPTTIVLKSTVPPGIHKHLTKILDQHTKVAYEFASAPEFLREGSAITDTVHPSRIVIGVASQKAKDDLLDIHKSLPGERIVTDVVSAQMIKYAANSLLATKISFVNGIARICDLLGADVTDVMKGVGTDPRIGNQFLSPGLGFGGSCFPKDIKGLYYLAKDAGYDFELLKTVDQINDSQVAYVISKIEKKYGSLQGKQIAIWGLAFKPDTDDMREARSVTLINLLLQKGAKVSAYDPIATAISKTIFGDKISFADSPAEAAKEADAIFLVTEWNEFKEVDFAQIKKDMKGDLLVDGRNMYDPQELKKLGFSYVGVGRD
ncbi:UDP-glucose/GDP-mannose dehydrogenase family protein [Candidatus Beckwithbacteria bacterium]|nr:UDP-glucose/GDP-mannose dehydrogenase family protein [Candidatus Beckwithbacteria bacterium]